MVPEHLAQTPFGAIALDGTSHSGAGCDHGHPRTADGRMLRRIRTHHPPQNKAAAVEAAAGLPHVADFPLAPQMLLGAKAHGRNDQRTAARTTESNDRQALTALATTRIDDLATTLGGHTGAEADLTDALFAVRTESGLHRRKTLKG